MITVALAPITQAGLNPTRDFAARLVAYIVGWGSEAIPGPHSGKDVVALDSSQDIDSSSLF